MLDELSPSLKSNCMRRCQTCVVGSCKVRKEQFSSKIIVCIHPNFIKKINDKCADHKCENRSAHFYGMMLEQHLWAYAFTEVPYQHFLDISKDGIGFIFRKKIVTRKQFCERKFHKLMQNVLTFTKIPSFCFFFLFSFPLYCGIAFFFSKSTNDDRSDNITSFLSGKMLLVYYPCQDIDF